LVRRFARLLGIKTDYSGQNPYRIVPLFVRRQLFELDMAVSLNDGKPVGENFLVGSRTGLHNGLVFDFFTDPSSSIDCRKGFRLPVPQATQKVLFRLA